MFIKINTKWNITIFILFLAIFLPSCAVRDIYNAYKDYEESKEVELIEIEDTELEGEMKIKRFMTSQEEYYLEYDYFYHEYDKLKQYRFVELYSHYSISIGDRSYAGYPNDKQYLIFRAYLYPGGGRKYREFTGKIEAQYKRQDGELDPDLESKIRFDENNNLYFEELHINILLCKQIDTKKPLESISSNAEICPSNSEKIEL